VERKGAVHHVPLGKKRKICIAKKNIEGRCALGKGEEPESLVGVFLVWKEGI